MKDLKNILEMFDTLNAPYFCDYRTLKYCFRKEIKRCHPDRSGDEEKAKAVISAFRELESLYRSRETLEYYKSLFTSQNHRNKDELKLQNGMVSAVFEKGSSGKEGKRGGRVVMSILGIFAIIAVLGDVIISLLVVLVIMAFVWAYRRI